MPFWRNETDEEKRLKKQQEDCRQALERGDIPPIARQRLNEQRASGRKFFTSDLSANEHMLTREAGYQVIGQVMGSCFYKVSFWGNYRAGARFTLTGEVVELSQAQLAARRTAVSRMLQEAKLLGASGVIGVVLKAGNYDWSSGLLEFTAIGTAVGVEGWNKDEPFASDLSGQDFWQLHQAGYWPCGLAMGVCTYYIYTDWNTQSMVNKSLFWGTGLSNQEIRVYSEGFRYARELAMQRLTSDTLQLKAQGVVGAKVNYTLEHIEYETNDTQRRDLVVHFTAIGTAIVTGEHINTPKRVPPLLCYNLASGKVQELEFEE